MTRTALLLPLLALAGVLLVLLARAARAEVGLLPPLEIACGVPSHARCVEAAALATANLAAEERAGAGLAWMPSSYFVAFRSKEAWGYAAAATTTARSGRERREALRDLIELVGWRAVLTGTLPPPVPEAP